MFTMLAYEEEAYESYKDQSSLLVEIMNFKYKARPQDPEKKQFLNTHMHFLMVQK